MSKCKVARKKKKMFFFDKGLFFSHLLVLFSRWFLFPFYQWDWFTTASWSSSCGENLRWIGFFLRLLEAMQTVQTATAWGQRIFQGFRCFPVVFWGSNNLCEKKLKMEGDFSKRFVFFFFFRSWWVFMLHVKISNYSEQFCASRNAWGIVTKSTHGYSKRYPPGN